MPLGIKINTYKLNKDCINDFHYFSLKYEKNEFKRLCQNATEKFVQVIDKTSNNKSIVFWHRLNDLFVDKKELLFVKKMRKELSLASQIQHPIDLWNMTKENSTTLDIAIERMAIYFQNQSIFIGHLNEDNYSNEAPKKMVQNINNVINDYNRSELKIDTFLLGIEFDSSKLYHVFVPAYITQKLIKAGIPQDLSVYLAFDFNWNYEMFDDPEFRFLDLKFRDRKLTNDTAKDILAAYIGSQVALDHPLDFRINQNLLSILEEDPSRGRHDVLMSLISF